MSSDEDKNDWKEEKERSNSFLLRFIIWVSLKSGRWFTRLFLYPIVLYFLVSSPKVIKASRFYLSRVLGKPVGIAKVARHVFCFAATILDRVYFITDQHQRFDVRFNNLDVLDQYIDAQQGCLLLGTHLGSFEVLRTLAVSNKTLPLKITMYAKHNQMITGLLDALNPAISKTVIDLAADDVLFQTQEALEQGFCVGMLGDRVTGSGKTTQCTLLGSPVDIPLGPLTLASIFKVPVILFFGLYQGKNRYDIYFEELTNNISAHRKERDKVVKQWTQQYVDRIEYHMKKSPYNWFNFYDYWNDGKSR